MWGIQSRCSTTTTKIFRFIDEIFFWYLYFQSINKKFINDLIDINNLLEKLSLVICGLSVSLSVITLSMDLLAQKRVKKIYSFHSVGIFIDEYNILSTEKTYVIPLVIFFHHWYFLRWIWHITDKMTIYNFIND